MDRLVAIADAGSVTIDWLATGRPPKTRAEWRNQAAPAAPAIYPSEESRRMALELIQEWQINRQHLLPVEKFVRAVELLAEIAEDEPDQVTRHADSILRLAA